MIALLLALCAHAAEPTGGPSFESETVVQLRQDMLGTAYAPVSQTLSVYRAHKGFVAEGVADLRWAGGFDRDPDADLYRLSVALPLRRLHLVVGRHATTGALRRHTVDGFTLRYRASRYQIEAWGGYGRNVAINHMSDGYGAARLGARFWAGPLSARVGVQVSQASKGVLLREDLGVDLALGGSLGPRVEASAVLAQLGSDLTLERARVRGSFWLGRRVQASVHAQHRQEADPSYRFADGILAAFAPDGVQEVGLGARLTDRRWMALTSSYALTSYVELEERVWGHRVDLAYSPPRTDSSLRLLPTYRFRAGPGGVLHAASLEAQLTVGQDNLISLRGTVAPYRKLRESWGTAAFTTLRYRRALGRYSHVQFGGDLGTDAHFRLDLRGFVALVLGVP